MRGDDDINPGDLASAGKLRRRCFSHESIVIHDDGLTYSLLPFEMDVMTEHSEGDPIFVVSVLQNMSFDGVGHIVWPTCWPRRISVGRTAWSCHSWSWDHELFSTKLAW